MSNKFIMHLFTKILEVRGHTPLSESAAKEALESLDAEYEAISQSEGSEMAENVLSYKTVKRALQQCLSYHANSNPSVTYEDNLINYEYAYLKLERAEKLIEEE